MSEILAKYLIDINKNLGSIAEKVSPTESSGGGTAITIDAELSADSSNPVENKAISAALAKKQDKLTAGANIQIAEDGTISATTSGSGSSSTAQGARFATFTNSSTSTVSSGSSVSIAYDTFTKAELEKAVLYVYGYSAYSAGNAPFVCVIPPATLESSAYATGDAYNVQTGYRFYSTGSGSDTHNMTRTIGDNAITLTPSGNGSYYIYAITAVGL